ncbi:MAG TPA: ABC transporter permease [Vicinamibacterales bacterium]|nr:ABC transporter permease [Vicinamibacterales bacterium]
MTLLHRLASIVRWIVRRNRAERDLNDELEAFVEMASADRMREGATAADARRAAVLHLGGIEQAKERVRSARHGAWLDAIARDLRYGVRTLRRTRLFTAVALVTLALGIGANTAIFSIVNGVILQPLGYRAPEQLMRLTAHYPIGQGHRLSTPEYLEFREMNRSFAAVGAFALGDGVAGGGSGGWAGAVNLMAGDRPVRARCTLVDEPLLAALGVQPAQGRLFAAGETDAMSSRPGVGGPPVAILSHELWQSALGGRPIVGQTVLVDGRPHDIIGIMPPGFDVMDNRTEIWLPIGVHPVIRRLRDNHVLQVIGRLKDGVTPQAADAELSTFLENWRERAGAQGHVPTAHPLRPDDHTLRLQPLQDAILGDARRVIWMLQAAAALVLLIACANLASLVLARAESRRREFALRATLGASRGRLIQQTIAEGVLLSVAGGAIGLWVARTGMRALLLAYPTSLPRASELTIDLSVLLFTLVMSVATGLLFGVAPVVQSRFVDLMNTLKEGHRDGGNPGRHSVRRALVIAEVALAVMLVVASGLLLRTVYNLTRVDAGFDRSRMVTFSMTLPRSGTEGGQRAPAFQRLLDTLRQTPGVQAATAMSDLPFSRLAQRYDTGAENYTNAEGKPISIVEYYQFVMSDFFETMGIPIVAGRGFDAIDTASEGRVVVINETLASRLWKGRDPIGQRLRVNLAASIGTSSNPWHTVIGVAKDVKEAGVDRDTGAELYLLIDQPGPPIDGTARPWVTTAPPTMHIVLRTNLPAAALAQTLERSVRAVNPSVPIVGLREMDLVFDQSIGRPRLLAQLLGAFAGLALLVAVLGVYGVLSFMVAERRREIGIRLAIGATRVGIVALVMKQGLVITAIGLTAGLAGALNLNRVFASLLFGVEPTDPGTLAAVMSVIAMVAAVACALPAWRASRLDPNDVLRVG